MPTLSPDALAALRVDWVGDEAQRRVLAGFRGVHPADFVSWWAESLADRVAGVFLGSQVESLAVAAENLTDLAGSTVTPDPAPWFGKVGKSSVTDFLGITTRGFMARIAGGMSPMESLVSTAGFLASSAGAEVHAVARGSTCYTASEDPRFQGWARVAEPGACDFCRMLAARGAVYESKDSASKRRDGLRYHTRHADGSGGLCRCTVRALPRGEGATAWDGKGAPARGRAKKVAAKSDPNAYRAGAKTPERARFVAHQTNVLRKLIASGGTAWDRTKLAELEAEQAVI